MITTVIPISSELYTHLLNANKKWLVKGRTAFFIAISAEPALLSSAGRTYEMAVETYEDAARYLQSEQLIAEPERVTIQALLHEYYLMT